MNRIIGVILILMGIALGCFLGLYVCLFGGVMQLINGIKDSFNAMPIAVGLIRILIASVVGWVSALALIIPGWALLTDD